VRNFALLFLVLFALFRCKHKEQDNPQSEPLIMAEQSEMALLMNQMYAYNESVKYSVKKGDMQHEYPEFFNKIFTAEFTDPSDRNEQFTKDALEFIEVQKNLAFQFYFRFKGTL
jgi:hypothetical protein